MANNIMSLPNMGVGQPGSPVQQGGGGRTDLTGYRSILDARRSMGEGARTPSAEYPDGYLGSITGRRDDKLLAKVKSRLGDKQYQRGVHKGERIEPSDYIWRDGMDPQQGLANQGTTGQRWAPEGDPVERLAHGGNNTPLTPTMMAKMAPQYGLSYTPNKDDINPIRSERMARYLPSWG